MGKFIYSTPNRAPVPANPAEGGSAQTPRFMRGFFVRESRGMPNRHDSLVSMKS